MGVKTLAGFTWKDLADFDVYQTAAAALRSARPTQSANNCRRATSFLICEASRAAVMGKLRRIASQCSARDFARSSLAMHDLWRLHGSLSGVHRTDAEDRGYAPLSGDGGIRLPPGHNAGSDDFAGRGSIRSVELRRRAWIGPTD